MVENPIRGAPGVGTIHLLPSISTLVHRWRRYIPVAIECEDGNRITRRPRIFCHHILQVLLGLLPLPAPHMRSLGDWVTVHRATLGIREPRQISKPS